MRSSLEIHFYRACCICFFRTFKPWVKREALSYPRGQSSDVQVRKAAGDACLDILLKQVPGWGYVDTPGPTGQSL